MVLERQVRACERFPRSSPAPSLGFVAFGGIWCWRHVGTLRQPALSVRQPGLPVDPTCPPRPFGTHAGWPGVPWTCWRRRGRWPSARPAVCRRFPSATRASCSSSSPQSGGFPCEGWARGTPLPPGQRNLLAFVLMAYAAWMAVFYYYRYAAILEFLAPLVLVILVQALLPRVGRPAALRRGRVPAGCSRASAPGSVGTGRIGGGASRSRPRPSEADSLVLLTSPWEQLPGPVLPREDALRGPRMGRLLALRRPGDRHSRLSTRGP